MNSNVIGVAHVGWLSRDPEGTDALRGRHAEYGRSVEGPYRSVLYKQVHPVVGEQQLW